MALLVGIALLGLGVAAGLTTADVLDARNPRVGLPARVVWALDRGDHLHYVVHLLAARAFGLCPCTQAEAAEQDWRAAFHARTPRQLALVDGPQDTGVVGIADVLVAASTWAEGDGRQLAAHVLAYTLVTLVLGASFAVLWVWPLGGATGVHRQTSAGSHSRDARTPVQPREQ